MSRRFKEVNFILESVDYSNLVNTSRRTSLEMIFLCLVRMHLHSIACQTKPPSNCKRSASAELFGSLYSGAIESLRHRSAQGSHKVG